MKKITSENLTFVTVLLGIMATLMLLFPALVAGGTDASYTGLHVALGHETVNLGGFANVRINFSLLNLVGYVLPFVGAMVIVFVKKGHLISVFVFAAAIVTLFMVPEFTTVTFTVMGSSTDVAVDWTYGIGLIIAIVLSFLALFISIYKTTRKA